jgi:hypothetical protein
LLILILLHLQLNEITISGKITNTQNEINIKGESFEKEIKLNADGLSENITIEYDGIYAIETGKTACRYIYQNEIKLYS